MRNIQNLEAVITHTYLFSNKSIAMAVTKNDYLPKTIKFVVMLAISHELTEDSVLIKM